MWEGFFVGATRNEEGGFARPGLDWKREYRRLCPLVTGRTPSESVSWCNGFPVILWRDGRKGRDKIKGLGSDLWVRRLKGRIRQRAGRVVD